MQGDQELSPAFPGVGAPDRRYRLDIGGLELALYEWGAADAPPIVFIHGGFDFARTFDGFAPLIAAAGWRVVAWDQRGHGDSDHAHLYSLESDVRDAASVVLHAGGGEPVLVLGHSKGGALSLQLADALPHLCRALVNLDGLPARRHMSDVSEHERTNMVAADLEGWLDHRRRTITAQRKPAASLEDLARRRGHMNPRLSTEWLTYIASHGARLDSDGWRWKIDPAMRPGGFGPWRPEWTMLRLAGLSMPFIGILGLEPEPMGWGTQPKDVTPYMPASGRLEGLTGVGHFVHIEQPTLVADMVLEFLAGLR